MADGAGSNGDAAGPPVGKEAAGRPIRGDGHIFTEAQCKVCSALLISESQRLAHYQSKKHANKVRRYLSIHGGEEGAHGKKMKLEAKQDSKQEGSNGEDRNKCCPICNMTFSSPAVATSHYLGKTHAKNMKQQAPKAEAGKGYPCSTCNIVLNSIEQYQAHISGFKHKNQMPGAVPVVGPFPPQQYVREESTAPGGYSYFSQDF
ncbi:zinc finger protein 346 isoform X2 [Corapipo altera]|uniref:zinc finger protein 346 isoform X2 n=1 Tax=Corapipo altera TaxID=415028 RepID=UPI000FD66487|nr:zinc finger protein 346 isoform X2 [Corapipo altera]